MIRLQYSKGVPQKYLQKLKKEINSPVDYLEDLKKKSRGPNRQLVIDLIRDFDDIIIAKPSELRDYIQQYGEVSEKFSKKLVDFIRYKNMRGSKIAIWLFDELNLKACPYCNTQFVISVDKKGKLLCQFDHIYPKTKYPYLALSIYNLLPACSYCNLYKAKGDPYNSNSFHHPFEKSLSDIIKFRASLDAIKSFQTGGRTKKEQENIEIEVSSGSSISFHERFLIKEIHNKHHDIIDEIYLKSQIFNSAYYEELRKRLVDDEGLLREDELSRIIYSNYLSEHEINKRPLSKMTQDLLEQFRKLNDINT